LLAGDLLTVLVNQYFGGGQLPAPEMRKRVTPSEQRVGERVAREFFRVMNEMWSDRLPLGFGDLFIDITTDRFSLIPDRTGFAVLPFEVHVSDGPAHTIDLLIPFDSLEAESAALTPKVIERPSEPETSWGADIRAALPEVSVDVSGEIGNVTTTLRALLAMGVGTVVPIDEPERVFLSLEGRTIAEGKYGAHEGFKAMQFTNFNGDLS
jgi:flagellar motor switch protein FliM